MRGIPYDVRRRCAKRLSCVCSLGTRVSGRSLMMYADAARSAFSCVCSFLFSLFLDKHEQEAHEQQTA